MRILRTLKPPVRKVAHDFFTLDIETWGLNATRKAFALACVVGYKYKKSFTSIPELIKELKHSRFHNRKIYVHNAEYDLNGIFGNIITELDNGAIYNGKFIAAKFNEKTTFADSTNIFPMSVEKIGTSLGYKKLETPKKFIEGRKSRIDNIDIEYCMRDAEIMYNALHKFFKIVKKTHLTIGSAAMHFFRTEYLKKNILINNLDSHFFDSYFGGRTEAFKIAKTNAFVYDANSLYPSCMLGLDVPDVKNLKRYDKPNLKLFKYLLQKKEGMAKVTVKHKEMYFGTLPKKMIVNKSNKLVFPIGTFTTTVNFNELRNAVEKGYATILDVEYCVCANRVKAPFDKYVIDVYKFRRQSNSIDEIVFKLLLNNLYGKFGMRKKFKTVYYKEIPVELIIELKETNQYHEVKMFSATRNDCYLVTENENKNEISHTTIAAYASYITSAARVRTCTALIENEKNNVVYCDTDSIFIEKDEPILNIGNDLGQWKKEDKQVLEIRGLKNYTFINKKGEKIDAIKGVSRKSKKIGRNVFQSKKITKAKESLRRQVEAGSPQIITKTITHKYDKRKLLTNGATLPHKL